jgi:hypothetical protein
VNSLLAKVLFLTLWVLATAAFAAQPDICAMTQNLSKYSGKAFTIHVPILYSVSHVLDYESDIRIDTARACKTRPNVSLYIPREPDEETKAFLAKVRELVTANDSSGCICMNCAKYVVEAEIQVEIKKWQNEPLPDSNDRVVFQRTGEPPSHMMVLTRVIRFNAKEIPHGCSK